MIKRIELKNFMAHKDTVLNLTDGLNVLVGPNNSGKSAVVAALQILCSNERGDYMVRHGERDCHVAVETGEGHRVEWRRENGAVAYYLNGELKDRLQGDIPEELHEFLRLESVPVGDDWETHDVHFGEQKSPIFLINQPGSRAAAFFASSSDSAKLLEMKRLHQRKVHDARREKQTIEEKLRQLNPLLESLEPVPTLKRESKQLQRTYNSLQQFEQDISALTGIVDRMTRSERDTQQSNTLMDLLETLEHPPELRDESSLESRIQQISAEETNQARLQLETNCLETLTPPPDFFETGPLDDLIRQLGDATVAHSKARDQANALADADRSPPELLDTQHLEELVDGISKEQNLYNQLAQASQAFDELAAPPSLHDLDSLRNLIDEMGQLEDNIKTEDGNIAIHSEALHQIVDQLQVCPFCGTELDGRAPIDLYQLKVESRQA